MSYKSRLSLAISQTHIGNMRYVTDKAVFLSLFVLIMLGTFAHAQVQVHRPRSANPSPDTPGSQTATQIQEIRRLVRSRYLQQLIAAMKQYPPEAAPLHELAQQLEQVDLNRPIDVAKLTDRNPVYWSTVTILPKGVELAMLIKTVLYAANGSLDMASRYLLLVRLSSLPNAPGYDVLTELHPRLSMINRDIVKRMRQGISLHDQGRYNEAIGVYESVLVDHPQSAWATYQIWFARMHGNMVNVERDWPAVAKQLYTFDPLFDMQTKSRNDKEAFQMLRRLDTRGMFVDSQKFLPDVAKRADIALDLDAYGMAGDLYWLWVKHADTSKGSAATKLPLTHFLYCVDRLDAMDASTTSPTQFNQKKAFKAVEKRQFDRMTQYLGRKPRLNQ